MYREQKQADAAKNADAKSGKDGEQLDSNLYSRQM